MANGGVLLRWRFSRTSPCLPTSQRRYITSHQLPKGGAIGRAFCSPTAHLQPTPTCNVAKDGLGGMPTAPRVSVAHQEAMDIPTAVTPEPSLEPSSSVQEVLVRLTILASCCQAFSLQPAHAAALTAEVDSAFGPSSWFSSLIPRIDVLDILLNNPAVASAVAVSALLIVPRAVQKGVTVVVVPVVAVLVFYLCAAHPDTSSAALRGTYVWTQEHPALTSAGILILAGLLLLPSLVVGAGAVAAVVALTQVAALDLPPVPRSFGEVRDLVTRPFQSGPRLLPAPAPALTTPTPATSRLADTRRAAPTVTVDVVPAPTLQATAADEGEAGGPGAPWLNGRTLSLPRLPPVQLPQFVPNFRLSPETSERIEQLKASMAESMPSMPNLPGFRALPGLLAAPPAASPAFPAPAPDTATTSAAVLLAPPPPPTASPAAPAPPSAAADPIAPASSSSVFKSRVASPPSPPAAPAASSSSPTAPAAAAAPAAAPPAAATPKLDPPTPPAPQATPAKPTDAAAPSDAAASASAAAAPAAAPAAAAAAPAAAVPADEDVLDRLLRELDRSATLLGEPVTEDAVVLTEEEKEEAAAAKAAAGGVGSKVSPQGQQGGQSRVLEILERS